MNIVDRLNEHALTRSDHPAVEDGNRRVSFKELKTLSENMAIHLRKLNIGPGCIVGFQLKNSVEQCALIWAIALCGATVFPIRYDSKGQEVEKTLDGIELALVVVEKGNQPPKGLKSISIQRLQSKLNQKPSTWPKTSVSDPLYMCHSSGTTGKPKTFVFSQDQFLYLANTYQTILGWNENDRFFFDMSMGDAWGGGLCLSLMSLGITIVIARTNSAEKSIEAIQQKQISLLIVLPWQLRRYLQYKTDKGPLFPDVKSMMTSASFLHPAERMLIRKYLTPNLVDAYGTTEFWFISAASAEEQRLYTESVGKICDQVEVEIVDEHHRVLANGETGRIRVRAPNMLQSYYNNPEATERCFRDGFFYPMDLGYLNDDGYLFLQGRTDDVIDFKGAKFYPIEVTNLLATYPGIEECAVFGWPDQDNGEVAAAALVISSSVEHQELDAFCQQHLDHYKKPKYYMFLSSLPKNPSGKVEVNILKQTLYQRLSTSANSNGKEK